MGVEPFNFMNFENEISEWEFTETDFSDEDLKSLESKVDVYLAKIKELDPSLHEDPQRYQLIDQQVKDFVSIERLHRSTAHNRHIFFAGIPLSHSVQLLSSLKELQAEREKAEKLEEKARKLSEEIDELNEEKRVDFYRFERSIQRAVSMGVGVNRLVREAQMGNELDSSDLSPMASHRDDAEVERGLLMRLESLIEQEMKMLV